MAVLFRWAEQKMLTHFPREKETKSTYLQWFEYIIFMAAHTKVYEDLGELLKALLRLVARLAAVSRSSLAFPKM